MAHMRADMPSPGKLVVKELPERLASDERGLVIVPSMFPDSGDPNRLAISGGIRREFLKPALLFWDKIVNPLGEMIEFDLTAEEAFLQSCGVLQRSSMDQLPGLRESEWLWAPEICFEALEARDGGGWCLFAEEDVRPVPSRIIAADRGILVKLHRAIAVPVGETPLEDLLEFKARRRDELQALRSSLAKFYETILGSQDRDFAKRNAFSDLEKAIADELKVMKESKIRSVIGSVKSNLSIGNVGGALFAFSGGATAGFPLLQSLGLAASALSIGVGLGLKDKKPRDKPFAYVGAYHRELRWN